MATSTNTLQNEKKLVIIKKTCDNSHKHCGEIITTINSTNLPITQEYFNDFMKLITNSNYCSCLSHIYNGKHYLLKKFILEMSKKLKIENFNLILPYVSDKEIYDIIVNQQLLDSTLIDKLMITEVTQYDIKTNFINLLLSTPSKIKTFEYVLMSMNLSQFSLFIDIVNKNFQSSVELLINYYINEKKNELMLKKNLHIGLKFINTFISKPSMILNFYSLISANITTEQKKEIFNKSIVNPDRKLILLMLEQRDVIPDIDTVNKLLVKSYSRPEYGSPNAKNIAEIIDLLCDYGLVITKNITMKILEKGCYINNLEKHGIIVDNDIISICADLSFYPYKFDVVPNIVVLKKECCKNNNLNTIKKLKEYGGVYTTECLEEACALTKNGKVICYLINECGVKVSNTCLLNFQEAYGTDALEIIMRKYRENNQTTNTNINQQTFVEIDCKSTISVIPRNIPINMKDDSIEYILKKKIKNFLECKKKNYKI